MLTILVPRGAEGAAVRRGARGAIIAETAAGAASATLPPHIDGAGRLVLVGLCGSLGDARVGDVVVYTSVVRAEGGLQFEIPPDERVQRALPQARPVVACTAKHVVTRKAERAALAAQTGAAVVDMEGIHVARALAARGIPFAMVRVVSDDPRYDLPPIEHAFDREGELKPIALTLAFARSPLAAVRFVRDVQASLGVLSGVAGALAGVK